MHSMHNIGSNSQLCVKSACTECLCCVRVYVCVFVHTFLCSQEVCACTCYACPTSIYLPTAVCMTLCLSVCSMVWGLS